jgi:6-phosphogluconolactonase (cycloisomerase 2 family)
MRAGVQALFAVVFAQGCGRLGYDLSLQSGSLDALRASDAVGAADGESGDAGGGPVNPDASADDAQAVGLDVGGGPADVPALDASSMDAGADASSLDASSMDAVVHTPLRNYVYAATGHSIQPFSISSSGLLMASAAAVIDGGRPGFFGFSVDRETLYVIDGGGPLTTNLYQHSIRYADGSLTSLGPPVESGAYSPPGRLLVHPDQQALYLAGDGPGAANVYQYAIAPLTGVLSPLNPAYVMSDGTPSMIVSTSNGDFVYAANGATGDISMYSAAANGALFFIDNFLQSSANGLIAMHPSGHVLYAVTPGAPSQITGYNITAQGTLASPPGAIITQAPGMILDLQTNPVVPVLYALLFSRQIAVYTMSLDGALALHSIVSTDDGPSYLAVTLDGAHAFATTNAPLGTISCFTINAAGDLTNVGHVSTGTTTTTIIAVRVAG